MSAPGEQSLEQLIVFVKAPRVGQVKTRLAASMGSVAACAVYRRLIQTLLDRLGRWRDVQLCFTPDDAGAEFAHWLRPTWRAAPQGAGDLGERLERAAGNAFRSGAARVAIIGSDCPEIESGDIVDAFASLAEHDLAIGPARDGGYWLIAMKEPRPSLFRAIRWSSSTVLEETLAKARARGLQVHLLRELEDIDTEEDWRSYLARAERSSQE